MGVGFGELGLGGHGRGAPATTAPAAQFFDELRGRAGLPLVARGHVAEGGADDTPVDAVAGEAAASLRELIRRHGRGAELRCGACGTSARGPDLALLLRKVAVRILRAIR